MEVENCCVVEGERGDVIEWDVGCSQVEPEKGETDIRNTRSES